MIYVDTSVLVAASTPSDSRHSACLAALQEADQKGGACLAHSMAEFYAVMSGQPGMLKVPPEPAAEMTAHIRSRFRIVTLSAAEYQATIASAAQSGHIGGAIYDCLHLACARKIGATRVLTLDADLRRLAQDLKGRIVVL